MIAIVPIIIDSAISAASMIARADESARRLRRNSLHMKIKFGYSWNSRDVNSRMPRISRRILDGQNVVLRIRIAVKNDVVTDLGHIKYPVHFRLVVAAHGIERHTVQSQNAAPQIAGRQSVASRAADH